MTTAAKTNPATTQPNVQEQIALQQFMQAQNELSQFSARITELETDQREHQFNLKQINFFALFLFFFERKCANTNKN